MDFVAIVNLGKNWIFEKDAFFDYISKKLLGYLPLPEKIYNKIINNKGFYLNLKNHGV